MRTLLVLLCCFVALAGASHAQEAMPGPIIFSAGNTFEVAYPDFETPLDLDYKVAFEIAAAAPSPENLNASFNSLARFINMHAAAGVPIERIQIAAVVHGPAGWELLNDAAYEERHGVPNPNAQLIRELIDRGMTVVLCGQTAASRGIPRDGLIDGVQTALSAMTAFVALQADGFQVNPW